MFNRIIYLLCLIAVMGCEAEQKISELPVLDHFDYDNQEFGEYWYAGDAELTSYDLVQNRYGEERKGSAVMIFVTEPFSGSKQVKLDRPGGEDEITVMKLNFTRNFTTGIYPYSMMLSAFTPVSDDQHPLTLKTTMSSQEWCGHTFSQFNLNRGKYEFNGRSYFESEGDEKKMLEPALLEDEVWNRIRLNPNKLPTGEFRMVPGSFFVRLSHIELEPQDAEGFIEFEPETTKYTLQYPESGRNLSIIFSSTFPYTIQSWTELLDKEMISMGVRKKSLKTDYWTKNANEHEYLRDSLGLKATK